MADELEQNELQEQPAQRILPRIIEEEMRSAYIDYSMSVIVSRALPDVRDGMKPVHRRVLYGMGDLGLASNRPYKKSARIVGEVLGKYHPHGDSAVYETMVRMAQPWSLRYMLVDGQGNFGSVDGDSPAAMRYTEARMQRIAEEIMDDIDKNTVDFRNNFDDSLKEPSVLPCRIPNLIVNGSSGIAVGMATNMAPHNLSETIDAIKAYIDDRQIDTAGLMQYIKGPDFPTAGIIHGVEGIREAYETGRGRVVVRARAEIETDKHGEEQIIISELPYQVNKATTVAKIVQLVHDKKIEGIADVRDESDREGMRMVVDIRKDGNARVVLNQLYQLTPLQSSFSINNVALVKGRPMTLTLKDLIRHFVDHRHEVVIRRTRYDLEEARKRAHILEGLLIALDHLDEVIKLIRGSRTPEDAHNGLKEQFGLSDLQSKAILDMRLQRLTGLERDKIQNEYKEIMEKINYYESVLADETLRMSIIKEELDTMKEKYGDKRRTEITLSDGEIRIEDIIANDEMILTISHEGYIKRTPLADFKVQGRGGKGFKGASTKDTDFVEYLFSTRNHNYMLFFTEKGKCFWLKVYEIPQGERSHKGRAIQNLIQIDRDDKVKAFITVESLDEAFVKDKYVMMATKRGVVKKTSLEAYSRPRTGGINAIGINDGDELIAAHLTDGKSQVVLAIRSGYSVRFHEEKVRDMGRTATGVRGITLDADNDEVIGMVVVPNDEVNLLVLSEKGYGKQTPVGEYRLTNRGGKGVRAMNVTDKTGPLVAIMQVSAEDHLMIITRGGQTIRLAVNDIREVGRATQGVRLIRLRGEDDIASVTKVVSDEDEETTAAVVVETSAGNAAPVADAGEETPAETTE